MTSNNEKLSHKVVTWICIFVIVMMAGTFLWNFQDAFAPPHVSPKIEAAMQKCLDNGRVTKRCLGAFVKFNDGTVWQFRYYADASAAFDSTLVNKIDYVVLPGEPRWEAMAVEGAKQFIAVPPTNK